MVHVRLRPMTGRSSPASPHSERSRSHSPPIRVRHSGITRMSSPLVLPKQLSPTDRETDKDHDKSLNLPKLPPTSSGKGDDVTQLRSRVAEYEQRVPHLERTIRQLQKQLDASKDTAERWRYAYQGDTKSGSQYRQEIVALTQQLGKQIELVQERDLAIENLTAHLQNPPSQNTSVCSSFLDDIDNAQSQEMERLLKENSAYAHRLLEQEEDLSKLRRGKDEGDRERIALGKKVAALTLQQASEKREVDILKRESALLESQVSALKQELSKYKGKEGNGNKDLSHPYDSRLTATSRSSADAPFSNDDRACTRDPSRNMKRFIELQNELRKVSKERDSSCMELNHVRQECESLRHKLEQSNQANDEEIKKLRTELWKARVLAESMEDTVAELDQTKFALHGSQRAAEDTASSLKTKFRDMNHTIVRLQGEIRKRDAVISDLTETKEMEKETERYLSVQHETRSLKTELDGALVDLEKASVDHTEQKKKLQTLQSTLRTRNDTILKLQRDLKSRTDNLLKSRKELVEREKTIKAMEIARSEAVSRSSEDFDALRKHLNQKDEEIELLQQELLRRGSSIARYRSEIAKLQEKLKDLEETPLPSPRDLANDTSEKIHQRELEVLKDKVSGLEREIIEKDIVIEELETDLDATRSTVREGRHHQCDGDSSEERQALQRTLVLPDSANDSSSRKLESVNEDLLMQLSTKEETIAKLEASLEDRSDELAKAHSEKIRIEQILSEEQNELMSLKSSLDQLKQELSDKEKLIAQKCSSIDKLHLEIHREKLTLQEKQQELQQKDAKIAENDVIIEQLRQECHSHRQNLEIKQKDLENKIDEICNLEKSLESVTEGNDSLRQELASQNTTIRRLRQKLEEKDTQLAQMESSILESEAMQQHETSRLERLRQDLADRDDKIVGLEASKKLISDSLEEAQSVVAKNTEEHSKLQLVLKQRGDDVESLLRDSKAHKATINNIRSDLEAREKKNIALVSLNKEIDLALQQSRSECCELKNLNNDLRILVQEGEAEAVQLRSNLVDMDRKLSQNSHQLSELSESKKLLSNTLEQASSELTKMTSDSTRTRKVLQERNDENERLIVDLKAHQQKLEEAVVQLEEKSAHVNELVTSLEETKMLLEKCNAEKQILEAELAGREASLEEKQGEKEDLDMNLEKKTMELEDATSECDKLVESKTQEIQTLSDAVDGKKGDFDSLRQSLQNRNLKIEQLEVSSITLNAQCKELSKEVLALQAENERVGTEFGTATSELEKARRESGEAINALSQKLSSLEAFEDPDTQSRSISFESPEQQERPRVMQSESEILKTDVDPQEAEFSKLMDGVAYRDGTIKALEETKDEALEALRTLQFELQAKESRIMELESAKAELFENVALLEEQVSVLSVENRDLSDELSFRLEEQTKSKQGPSSTSHDSSRREQSLDDIRRLIEEGLESVHQLEQLEVEAAGEAFELRREPSSTLQETEALKERIETYERELSVLQQELEDKESEAKSLRESNCRTSNDVLELRQTILSAIAENARLKCEAQAHVGDVAKLHKQLEDAGRNRDPLDSAKQHLETGLEEMKNEAASRTIEKLSLEEELNLSLEEVAGKDTALAEFQKASSDSFDAREILQQKVVSMEEQLSRLRQQLSSRTKHLVKARHDLMAQGDALEKAKHELMEQREKIHAMEERLVENDAIKTENERLKVDIEREATELKSILGENKRLKAETERKKSELKGLSEETENLRMNFMRQHDELKTLSDENQILQNNAERKEVQLAKMHNELLEKNKTACALDDVKSKMNEALDRAIAESKGREIVLEERVLLVKKSSKLQEEISLLNIENEKTKDQLKEKSDALSKVSKELDSCKRALAETKDSHCSNSKVLRDLEEKNSRLEQKCHDLRAVNNDLESKVEELMTTIADLNLEVSNLKDESFMDASFESLKDELQEVKKSGDEKVQSYERQICALTMNKDVTIDTLRKDLAAARSRSAEEVARLTNELSKVQEQNRELENQCNDESIRLRDQRIYALEHTLLAQEKTVDSLRAELDQLQLSMSNAAEQRRQDIEELQKELMDSQSNLQKRVRECSALKSELDDFKLRHDADMEDLNKEIEWLRNSSSSKRTKDLWQSAMMSEVKTRLEQLRGTNNELKEQNTQLAARLERASERVKIIEAEKEAAAELEEECAELRRQVKELEALLESASTSKSGSTSKSRVSEASLTTPSKEEKKDSKGMGLGIGRRKSKIPSVLFIGKSKDSQS